DAWRLAVPDADHAVEARAGERAGELRAPHRGGAQLLVDRRPQDDVVRGGERAEGCGLAVEAGKRRARVAGHERRGSQAGAHVGAALVEQHAHERLDAGHQHAPLVELVAVRERGAMRPGWTRGGVAAWVGPRLLRDSLTAHGPILYQNWSRETTRVSAWSPSRPSRRAARSRAPSSRSPSASATATSARATAFRPSASWPRRCRSAARRCA